MRTAVKTLSLLVSLSSLTLLSGTSFAASRPQPKPTQTYSFTANTTSTTASSLTADQKAQASKIAQETETINTTNGYVSVNTSVLTQHGLSPQQVNYVEDTINAYDAKYGLTSTSTTPTSLAVSPTTTNTSISENTPIWYKSAAFTKQMVMLYEGLYQSDSWGWEHMAYRHNWTTAAGQKAVEIAVHQAQYYTVQSNGRYEYDKWFTTTVPFEDWSVLIMIVVSPGNATGNNLYGPGSVVTGYPISGSYTTETWHGTTGTSIVPWWINDGYYAQTLK